MWKRKKPWQSNVNVCKATYEDDDYSYRHCSCLNCRVRRNQEYEEK